MDTEARNQIPSAKESRRFSSYLPLLSLVLIAAAAACALLWGSARQGWMAYMHFFAGVFLVFLGSLKVFDLNKFADGFQMYDLLAKQFRPYAYIYPFVELSLGFGLLAFWRPGLVYTLLAFFMFFGAAGVINALKKGLDMYCPCMGNVLKVPLSTVTLSEDLVMGFMGLAMLFNYLN